MRIIALFGPTGVGKTAVAIALARQLRDDGEDPVAVSADALQLYAGLEILTGAVTAAEQRQLEHRLVSCLALDETCSVGRYAKLAHTEIDGLLAQGRRPIVVGGTGLYLRAALGELDLHPPAPPEIRERLRREIEARGTEALHARLAERAPALAERIDPHDKQRIIRGLEIQEMQAPNADRHGSAQLWGEQRRHPTLLVALTMRREALYARIDERVQEMLAAGVLDEVARADAAGASQTARKAMGYSELLMGDVEAMKQRTRNYAKRQLTWMRKLPSDLEVDVGGCDAAAVAREILDSAAG